MEKINNLDDLILAREQKRSVFSPNHRIWKKPKPAAFMLHQPGCVLYVLFRYGMFIYHKKEKE